MTSADVARVMSDSDRTGVSVVFRVPPSIGALYADVAGDFSAWALLPMEPLDDGGFYLELRLDPGRRWRYRFLIDGTDWVNDPDASEFVALGKGGNASVVVT